MRWRPTYTGGEGVHADAVLAPFLGDGSAHLLDSGLAGVVRAASQSLQRMSARAHTFHTDCQTYAVGDLSRHAGDEQDAALALAADEHAGSLLSGHKDTDDVDFLYALKVGDGVLEGRDLLLDASACDGAPEGSAALVGLVGDLVEDLLGGGLVGDVALVVCDGEVVGLGQLGEVSPLDGGGLGEDVEAGGVTSGFEDGEGEGDSEATAAAGDDNGLVGEGEELRSSDGGSERVLGLGLGVDGLRGEIHIADSYGRHCEG